MIKIILVISRNKEILNVYEFEKHEIPKQMSK